MKIFCNSLCLFKISSASKVANLNYFRYFERGLTSRTPAQMLRSVFSFLLPLFKSHTQLHLEVLFLRKQLEVVTRLPAARQALLPDFGYALATDSA
jgi:hypothetical protein